MVNLNKRQRIPKGQSKKDNPEKHRVRRRRKTKQKHNTICVGHHYEQIHTKKDLNLLLVPGGFDIVLQQRFSYNNDEPFHTFGQLYYTVIKLTLNMLYRIIL